MASHFTALQGAGAPRLAHEFKVMLLPQWVVVELHVQEKTGWNAYSNCLLLCGKCDMLGEKQHYLFPLQTCSAFFGICL